MAWLETAPILAVGSAILVGLLVVHELAWRIGRRVKGKQLSEARGYLVSSALALLGLLMAFTFAAAQDRYRLRQELMISEANAIGTSYLRFRLLDPPWRDQLAGCLLRYAETRGASTTVHTAADIEANARESAVLQERIWALLATAVRTNSVPTLNLALVQSLNETFDLAASRRAAREVRVPAAILRVLLVSSLMVAALIGYTEASERRETGVLLGILLLLTVAFCLILDLDRPFEGAVTVSDLPLQRTLDDIRRGEAGHAGTCAASETPGLPARLNP